MKLLYLRGVLETTQMKHPHTKNILSLFWIPLVLEYAAKSFFKIGSKHLKRVNKLIAMMQNLRF